MYIEIFIKFSCCRRCSPFFALCFSTSFSSRLTTTNAYCPPTGSQPERQWEACKCLSALQNTSFCSSLRLPACLVFELPKDYFLFSMLSQRRCIVLLGMTYHLGLRVTQSVSFVFAHHHCSKINITLSRRQLVQGVLLLVLTVNSITLSPRRHILREAAESLATTSDACR